MEMTGDIANIIAAVNRLNAEVKKAQDEKAEAAKECERLRVYITERVEEINNLTIQIKGARNERESVLRECETLRHQATERMKEINTLTTQAANAKAASVKAARDGNDLRILAAERMREVDRLRNQLDEQRKIASAAGNSREYQDLLAGDWAKDRSNLEATINRLKLELVTVNRNLAAAEDARKIAVAEKVSAEERLASERQLTDRLDKKHTEELRLAQEAAATAGRQLKKLQDDAASLTQSAAMVGREREKTAVAYLELEGKFRQVEQELSKTRQQAVKDVKFLETELSKANARAPQLEADLNKIRADLRNAQLREGDASARLSAKTGELLGEKQARQQDRQAAVKTEQAMKAKISALEDDLAAERRRAQAITMNNDKADEVRRLSATVQAQQKRLMDFQGELIVERQSRQRDGQLHQEIVEAKDRQIADLKKDLIFARTVREQLETTASKDHSNEKQLSATIADLREKILTLSGENKAEREARVNEKRLADQREAKLKRQITALKNGQRPGR